MPEDGVRRVLGIGPLPASVDVHIEAWIDKIFSRMGWSLERFPYYSLQQLHEAFDGVVTDAHSFAWKGIETFWGRKPG